MSRGRRRTVARPLMGDLERYGLLALIAAFALGLAYLGQELAGEQPPFRAEGFRVGAAALVEVPETFEDETPATVAAERSFDAPGGGRTSTLPPASAGSPVRRGFDFFEPPVRLPGRPAVIAPPPPGASGTTRRVRVRKGETLQKIAARELGNASQWRLLLQSNPGLDPRKLQEGQELLIPAAAAAPVESSARKARLHDVAAEETLLSIAERYYGDPARWIDLLEANRDQLHDPGALRVGMKLRIP